jgi:mannose-6-phosphate isomerase-like protein (cupin superfamily)
MPNSISGVAELKIETRDTAGNINGWVLPLWSALEHPELRPDQVYVTAIAPHSRKGPHLHRRRRGLFACVSGRFSVWIQLSDGTYDGYSIEPGEPPTFVPAGIPCALYNYGDTEALVVNMPSPAWSADDPDEWPVEDWQDPPGWRNR